MKTIKLKNIKTGAILLESSHGFLPEAIQGFQGNAYNHAGFFYRSCSGKLFVSEAVKTGVGFNSFEDHYLEKFRQGEIDLLCLTPRKNYWKEINHCQFLDFLLEHTTDRYEIENLLWWQAVKYAWKWLTGKEKWIGKKTRDAYICGEWVAKIYNQFTGLFPTWEQVAPVDIFNNPNFIHKKIILDD